MPLSRQALFKKLIRPKLFPKNLAAEYYGLVPVSCETANKYHV